MTKEDLQERFRFPGLPVGEKTIRVADLLDDYFRLAATLQMDCGNNRELTIAMERLEESAQWAVKSIINDTFDYDTTLEDLGI